MSLAATGTQAFTALAATQAATFGALKPTTAIHSGDQGSSESSFAMADSSPRLTILPTPSGLWRYGDKEDGSEASTVLGYENTDQLLDNAAMYFTASDAAVMSVLLVGFLAMSFFTRTRKIVGNILDSKTKGQATGSSAEFVPFVTRADPVSPLNPLRVMGGELPGKAVTDPEEFSNIFGKKGIQ